MIKQRDNFVRRRRQQRGVLGFRWVGQQQQHGYLHGVVAEPLLSDLRRSSNRQPMRCLITNKCGACQACERRGTALAPAAGTRNRKPTTPRRAPRPNARRSRCSTPVLAAQAFALIEWPAPPALRHASFVRPLTHGGRRSNAEAQHWLAIGQHSRPLAGGSRPAGRLSSCQLQLVTTRAACLSSRMLTGQQPQPQPPPS